MTSATTERPTTPWQAQPGWGITVDLTPREIVQARQVRVHRRLIGLVLILILGLCAGASLLTRAGTAAAQRDYDREQARTTQLTASASEFAPIVTMQTVTARVQNDLAAVLAPDVDIVNLLARIRFALPAGLTLTTESVLLTPPPAAPPAPATDATGAPDAAATPAPATSTTGQVIGSVTLSGTGADIAGVTPFVAALDDLRGVVDVLPVSVTQGAEGMDFTISLNLTDKLYVERDATAGGS